MNKLAKIILGDAKDIKIDFSEFNNKTILITGATGLIGTYLVASLKPSTNAKVIIVAHNKPDDYYFDLLPNGAKILTGDLTNIDFLKTIPEANYIIHAAGYGQPGKFLDDPVKTLKLNTLTTFSLLEKLKPSGKFLFVSTSEVYSGSKNIPYKENDTGNTNTTHKRACYIEGKRSGEAITFAHNQKVVRLSLAYGPGTKKNDQRVLNSFIEKALDGKISMLDSGKAKRTYLYITDAVEIMWNVLLFGKNSLYNVAGESKTTIFELAKKIGDYLNVPVKKPAILETLEGAPEDVWLDITKIKNEFNKTDFINLDEGLKKTIEWQKLLYKK